MQEQLKKEWQEFVESQVWQGEDEFTKNMGVGNVADWWIEKFSSRQISLIKMIIEMVESEKKPIEDIENKHQEEFQTYHDRWFKYGYRDKDTEDKLKFFESGLMQGNTGERQGKIQALDTISSKLKELYEISMQ